MVTALLAWAQLVCLTGPPARLRTQNNLLPAPPRRRPPRHPRRRTIHANRPDLALVSRPRQRLHPAPPHPSLTANVEPATAAAHPNTTTNSHPYTIAPVNRN